MSPHPRRPGRIMTDFPRVSGDEPQDIIVFDNLPQFSPRERG